MRGLMAAICMGALLLFSSDAMEAASEAAGVFVHGVMPALFPMMVLCRMMPLRSNHEHSRMIADATLFAFLSGSPASAQRVRRLWDAGKVSEAMLPPLLAVTGVMSPMFFIGTLAGWTGRGAAMWVMLGIHWLSAMTTAGLIIAVQRMRGERGEGRNAPQANREDGAPVSLSEAITASAQALMAVCGAMMLFSIIAGVGKACLMRLFPDWTAAHEQWLSVLWALLEIGGGSAAVLGAWDGMPLALLSGLCAFGGLSIALQNLLFVEPFIRPMRLIGIRALHGVLSLGMAQIVFECFPLLAQAFAAGARSGGMGGSAFSPLIPVLLICLARPFRAS